MCIDSHMIIYMKSFWHISMHWFTHDTLSEIFFNTLMCIDSHMIIYLKNLWYINVHWFTHDNLFEKSSAH
jgi:hypothetical protein